MDTLRAALAATLPETLLGAPVGAYTLSNLRYSPREKLVLGLVAPGGRPVSLRLFPAARVDDRFAKAQADDADLTFRLPTLDAVAWIFPAERKLKLQVVADRERVAALVREARGVELTDVELVHYVPEHTYTARLRGRTAGGVAVTEYLKVYYDETGARTSAVSAELGCGASAAGLAIPSDQAYVDTDRVLLQRALDRDPQRRVDDLAAARALAQFHALRASTAPVARDDSRRDLEATAELAAMAFPAYGARVRALCRKVASMCAAIEPGPVVLLHGDPHLGNLFPLRDGRTAFIDLDAVRLGPAERDLASYFAFKLWLGVRRRQAALPLLPAFDALVAAYNEQASRRVEMASAWLRLAVVMLIERVKRGIVRGKLHHADEMLEFLAVADRSLELAAHA
jgi:hypothetical protein